MDVTLVILIALSLAAAAVVWRVEGTAAVLALAQEDALLLLAILPKVVAGCVIGAFVRLLVPRELVVRWVGSESGLRGLAIAAAAGAIFPGGPFTIFPIAAGFLLAGADRGAAAAFVTGWLLLGLNRALIWEMPFLGAEFVGFRTLLSLPFPPLVGLAVRAADRLWPEGAKP